MVSKSADSTIKKLNDLGPKFVKEVTKAINARLADSDEFKNYEVVWKHLQSIAVETINPILKDELPGCKITVPKSKSTYPDIKLQVQGNTFAIDIKSNEIKKNPWFDMARIDTVVEKRLEKYDEEWELIIKYDIESEKFLKAFFNLFREIVGKREDCKGVKYRPYDGKLRPKSWDDFDNNKIYWHSKKEFLEGIKRSQKNRWKKLIIGTLIPILNDKDKKDFKALFD